MSDSSQPPLSEDEARRQRQDALSALAHNQLAAPAPSSSGSTSSPPSVRGSRDRSRTPARGARRRPPSWLIIMSVVLALVLVAGLVLHQLGTPPSRSAQRQSTPVSLVLTPSAHGLACILDTAWSPDGRQIAVIGYQGQCPSDDPTGYNYQPGVLQIYSVATGQLVHSLLPDATVLKLPGIPAVPAGVQPTAPGDDISTRVLDYTHVLWSPDGLQVALTFDILKYSQVATTTISVPAYSGLVLVDADGTHERAALLPDTTQQNTALQWTISRVGSPGGAAKQRVGDVITLPPALTYSWNAAGQLAAGTPLSAASSAAAPTGNPDGGSSFTVWQPGQVGFYTEGSSTNGSPVAINPGIYTLQTAFAAWSPDGRYLIDSVSLFGIVHPAGAPPPTAAGLHALLGTDTMLNLPIRDRALQHAMVAMNSGGNGGGQNGVDLDEIAWSPSGQVLAAFPDPVVDDHPSVNSAPVTLYDSATGKTMETLQPSSSASEVSENSESNPSTVYWSPDGTHLLTYSDQEQTITTWGPITPPPGASA